MAYEKIGGRGIARRENWPLYLGGVLTEIGFILSLTVVAFLLALIAMVIWR